MSGTRTDDLPFLPGYEFSRVLGSGTTGTVYLARQSSTDRDVAVKVLAAWRLDAPGFRERFRAEARLMTQFDDENLVDVYDYVERDGGAYLVMQYVPGAPLREVVKDGRRLTPEQSLGVLAGALSGLAAAHRLGVVHGDLKPENVIVTEEGVSKLVDFGQAGPTGSKPSGGTPAYASPEALRDEPVDARSDVYAAGLILYELLTGRPPFVGTAGAVAAAHRDSPPPRLHGVPDPVGDLVARSLSKSPGDRPATAEEFLAELGEAAEAGYGPDWRRRASLAAVAGAVIGALSAGATELAGGSSAAASTGPSIPTSGRLRRIRRLASRVHHAATAHPVSAVATVAVVGGVATALSLIGSPAAVAGAFTTVSGSGQATEVTCPDATHCWVDLGSAILILGPGGQRTLSQIPAGGGTIADISCASDTYCIAVGATSSGDATALATADGGLTWRAASLPSGTGAFTGVSCVPGATECWAASRSGLFKNSGGGQWTQVPTPNGSGPITTISCSTADSCVGIADGTAEATHDSGATWTSVGLPGLLYTAASVDCVNASVCWVVGEYTNSLQSQIGTINRTTDGGATWSRVAFPSFPQPYGFDSVSCWTPTSCLVDGTVEWGGLESSSGSPYFLSTADGGVTWAVHLAPETMPFVPDIYCPGAAGCWLSGQSGVGFTTDGGSGWAVDFYGPKLTVSALSCLTATDCYASGAFPDLTRNHLGAFILPTSSPMGVLVGLAPGGGYSTIEASDPAIGGLAELSCTSAACVAAGNTTSANRATVVRLQLSGPGNPVTIPLPAGVQSVTGLACPQPTICLVSVQVNGQPEVLRRSGSTWATLPVPFGTQDVGAITCPRPSQCLLLATGASGPQLLDGTIDSSGVAAWQDVAIPAGVRALTAIECVTTKVCWLAGQFVPAGSSASNTTVTEMYRTLHLTAAAGVLSSTSTTAASTTATTSIARSAVPTRPVSTGDWAAQPIPVGVTGITAIACPTTGECFAIASLSNGYEALLGAGRVGTVLQGEVAPPPTT
jgi:serine/threonine-protein kinase